MTTEMEEYVVIVAHEAFNAFKSDEADAAEFITEAFNKKYGQEFYRKILNNNISRKSWNCFIGNFAHCLNHEKEKFINFELIGVRNSNNFLTSITFRLTLIERLSFSSLQVKKIDNE